MSVTAHCGEDVSILWQVTQSPDRGLMCHLRHTCESFVRMISLEVVDVKLGLEGGCHQLVHGDVWSIELNSANTVAYICVPPQAVCLQVEHLDISVIVSRHDATLLRVVSITEADGPAVRLDGLLG